MFFAWWILHLFWILHLYIIKLSDTDIEISLQLDIKCYKIFIFARSKLNMKALLIIFSPFNA